MQSTKSIASNTRRVPLLPRRPRKFCMWAPSMICLPLSNIRWHLRYSRPPQSLPYPSYSARRSSPGRRSSPRNVMQIPKSSFLLGSVAQSLVSSDLVRKIRLPKARRILVRWLRWPALTGCTHEPPNWARLYGWRPLSPLECHAYYVFWAEIGRRMGMQDIPESLEEMKAWSAAYEEAHMLPAQSNKDMADWTMQGLHNILPRYFGLGNYFGRLTVCLLDDRVRIAMMQPAQPWYMHAIMRSMLYSVAFVQRWLCLPRWNAMCLIDTREPEVPPDGSCPRLYPTNWVRKPWYKPQSSGLGYIRDRLAVFAGLYTEMPGPHLKSAGYRLEELGPISAEKQGHEKVLKMASELLEGCPVTGTSYKPF